MCLGVYVNYARARVNSQQGITELREPKRWGLPQLPSEYPTLSLGRSLPPNAASSQSGPRM